ncbi:hypothetical protein LX64_01810 [Chitinophaga skermanii]|uniref:Uncharacterized protein n=1 Tax=Chitinophaga skermanii TaxID=331697 RepID=A0A327QTE6_9BACT|nr:hypothetical protein [Chitinophaga skermanii]RAJ06683.1 hypothetical protein LX64_01810 [Chitinophaga skermanii]
MTSKELDPLLIELGTLLLTDEGAFQSKIKSVAPLLKAIDIAVLNQRLHNPPQEPKCFNDELGLGGWMSVIQYVIFEIVYHSGSSQLKWIRDFAYGEYDWTQATALTIICRWYVEGKIEKENFEELDTQLYDMRYETWLNLAQALYGLAKRDERYFTLIDSFTTPVMIGALVELGVDPSLQRKYLIQIGQLILDEANEDMLLLLTDFFNQGSNYPNAADLLYFPGEANIDPYTYEPNIAEIVDKCLAYKLAENHDSQRHSTLL